MTDWYPYISATVSLNPLQTHRSNVSSLILYYIASCYIMLRGPLKRIGVTCAFLLLNTVYYCYHEWKQTLMALFISIVTAIRIIVGLIFHRLLFLLWSEFFIEQML